MLHYQLILSRHVCKICYTQFDITRLEKIDLSRLQNDLDNTSSSSLAELIMSHTSAAVCHVLTSTRACMHVAYCPSYTGVGFLRRGSQRTPHLQGQPAPSPLARVSGERCQLPQRGPGRSPGSQAVFSERICCRPSVCRLSVTLVHPIQAIVIFGNGNISTALGTLATR